jgi:SAM-dependent methyltransferase
MNLKSHWERIYRDKLPTQVSWYQPHALRSLDLIRRVSPPPDGAIIDVGSGASTLIDDLLDAGYHDLTVLDLSAAALAVARARLGTRANTVQWIEADVLSASLPKTGYSVWHDRAAFHFLTAPVDRARYVAQVRQAVRVGGWVLVATFADDGPTRCSGLEVARYSPEALHAEFGAPFQLLASEREGHVTPAGVPQAFIYCLCRMEELD